MENEEARDITAGLAAWQDHMQGQIECLTRVLCGLLRSADPAAPHVVRMTESVAEWREMLRTDEQTPPATRDGFDTVHRQVLDALQRGPTTAH